MGTSRFTRLESLPLNPGHDWVTKSTVGPFVDTSVDIQFGERGRLYLSLDTIRELADVAGILDEYKQTADAATQSGYDQGYREATRDNFGADLRRAVADLRDLAGVLSLAAEPDIDEAGGAVVPITDSIAVGEPESTDGAAGPRREGAGARRKS